MLGSAPRSCAGLYPLASIHLVLEFRSSILKLRSLPEEQPIELRLPGKERDSNESNYPHPDL